MGYVGEVNAGGSTHLVGSTLYGTGALSTSSTDTINVSCANFDTLIPGVTIHVKFTDGIAVPNPKLNVNSTGANPLVSWTRYAISDTSQFPDGTFVVYQNCVIPFTFDGSSWIANGYDTNTYYETMSESQLNNGTNISPKVVTPKLIHDYVTSQMSDVAGALVYKGTVSAGTALLNTALKKGWYYIVDTAGSYAGTTCEPGDMIIVNTAGTYTTATSLAAAVDIIQTNIDTIANSEIDTIVAS